MIVVRLIGGLGNQLFQYAAARRLAYVNNTNLKLDISDFQSYAIRSYSLNHFKIIEDFATSDEIACFRRQKYVRRYLGFLRRGHDPTDPRKILEPHFHFYPEILSLAGNVYLEGYWQSEKYFEDIQSIVREEFTIKTKLDAITVELGQRISNLTSVSLHIRRCDYVNDPRTRQFHGICDLDYYHRAVEMLSRHVQDVHFFIFSDDPKWAESNLRLKNPSTLVTHNGPDKHYADLYLISQCQHHIIANSTFSWWGAWLSCNASKLVIAPAKWFTDSQINTVDLFPKNWITI